jgi:hypothetical protein
MNVDLRRLYRVVLVVNGRGRTCQIKDFIYLHIEWKADVMTHQLKIRMTKQIDDIPFATGVEIVHAQYVATIGN